MGALCSNSNMAADSTNDTKGKTRQQKIDALIDYSMDIGLQMNPKNEIPDLTYDIKTDLKKLKEFYPKLFQDLVKREMKNTVFYNNFDAKYVENSSFTVLQFNMLADALSRAYMPGGVDDDKAFVGVDKRCLEWRYRGLRIVEEITRVNPDIVCIQECDRVEYLDSYMSKLGYKHVFQEKGDSAGVRKAMPAINKARSDLRQSLYSQKSSMYSNVGDDSKQENSENPNNPKLKSNSSTSSNKLAITKTDTNGSVNSTYSVDEKRDEMDNVQFNSDGCAIFYKGDKFEEINRDKTKVQRIEKTNNENNPIGLCLPLSCKANGKEFWVITSHLKSEKSLAGEQKRELQIRQLLDKLFVNEENLDILLCLDMNGTHKKDKYDPLCYEALTKTFGYKSLHKEALTTSDELKNNVKKGDRGSEPLFTTYKTRSTGTVKHTIDYIFDNGCDLWTVTKYWEIPETAEVIPDWNYPSDHFSLCLQLTWNK